MEPDLKHCIMRREGGRNIARRRRANYDLKSDQEDGGGGGHDCPRFLVSDWLEDVGCRYACFVVAAATVTDRYEALPVLDL